MHLKIYYGSYNTRKVYKLLAMDCQLLAMLQRKEVNKAEPIVQILLIFLWPTILILLKIITYHDQR